MLQYLWFVVLGWILTAVAVTGNGLVIYLITTKPRLHTTANWFVLSLAVADFLTGIYFHPSHVACLPGGWFTCGGKTFKILRRVRWFFLNASIGCLCMMAADRYVAISKPLKYLNVMKRNRVIYMISASWIVSFVLNAVPFTWILSDGVGMEDKRLLKRMFLLTVLLLFEFLPCIILATATGHMLLIVRRHVKETAALHAQLNFNRPSPVKFKNKDSSSAKVIMVVVAVFILCFILDMYLTFCYWFNACSPPDALFYVNKLLLLTNATMNPVAYSFLKKDIKNEVRKLLGMRPVANAM